MTPAVPFGAQTTAAEVLHGVDLSGRRAVVTGAASGIGVETARALLGAGAAVTLAVRDVARGESVAAELRDATGNPAADVRALELADRASVAAFAAAWDGPLHALVLNAGVMALPERTRTPDGVELQFATNHLGHFQLATALHGALAGAGDARVVVVSSSGHLVCPVLFDDLAFAFVRYDPFTAYGQSKTANVLFAVEAARRWAADGIAVNALMPGGIVTGLQRHVDEPTLAAMRRAAGATDGFKTPEQGAATSVLLAGSPLVAGVSGRYYEDCAEAPVLSARDEGDGRHGVAPYALDPANAERLWALSETLLAQSAEARR